MAKKISELSAGTALSGTEKIPMVQGGGTKTTTPADIAAYIAIRAEWRADTFAGFGSTDNKIPYFTNVRVNENSGSHITVVNNSTNGCKVTVNIAGVYAVSYYSFPSSSSNIGLSINSSELTTNIVSITTANRIALSQNPTADSAVLVSWTGYLAVNDVIRPHTDGTGTSAGARSGFSICKII